MEDNDLDLEKLLPLVVLVAIIVAIRFVWKKGKRAYNDFTHNKRTAELARQIHQCSDAKKKAQAYAHRASYWARDRLWHYGYEDPERNTCYDAAIADYTKAIIVHAAVIMPSATTGMLPWRTSGQESNRKALPDLVEHAARVPHQTD